MTVSSEVYRNQYSCNGSQTEFPYTFRILDEEHLKVVLTDSGGTETVLTLTTDYTVSGVGDASGGNVTTVETYASGNTITIVRDVPLTQETDYIEGDDFPAQSHEDALDKLTMMVQQQQEFFNRTVMFPVSDSDTLSAELPAGAERAGKYLAFDANGEPIASEGTPGAVAVSSWAATLLDDESASEALQTLGLDTEVETDLVTTPKVRAPASENLSLVNDADHGLKIYDNDQAKFEGVSFGGASGALISEIETSLTTDSDTKTPTSKAVADHVDAEVPPRTRKAGWVTFKGSDGTIYDSYGVDSITRNATGDYTINFSTATNNANYPTSWMSDAQHWIYVGSRSESSVRILVNDGSGATDPTKASFSWGYV